MVLLLTWYMDQGEIAVLNKAGSSNILNQLYVYNNVTEKFMLTLGNQYFLRI